MKFNPTCLEILIFLIVCQFIYIWTKHRRRIRRWIQDYFRRRRGPRNLIPKSPEVCTLCNRHICFLPHRPKQEVVPWSKRKSRRGRPKLTDTAGHACLNPLCDYFAIADPAIHALVSNGRWGKQRILYLKCQSCGGCRTSRYSTPLYWLKTPLARIAMVITAMSEGVDISAAGRIFSHHHTTITRWIERCGRHSERLHERLFHRALSIGHLQLDERVTKVKRDTEKLWVWKAVAAKTKLIMAFHIGRRSSVDAPQLLHQVWQRLTPEYLPIFTSDGLNQYFYGITAHFGFWDKPKRARRYHWFPDLRLQYAQLRKRRQGGRVFFLYSIVRLGSRQFIRAGLKALPLSAHYAKRSITRGYSTENDKMMPLLHTLIQSYFNFFEVGFFYGLVPHRTHLLDFLITHPR